MKKITDSKLISSYKNGNTRVSIFEDGTKIRKYDGEAKPDYPESIDIKISNFCDLSEFCKWCHEASDKQGKHANLDNFNFLLEQLPPGAELAIGGGNPLSHPNILSFLEKAKDNGIICNMTVNELHLKPFKTLITKLLKEELIKGLGITYSGKKKKELEYFCKLSNNIVFHVIMGVHELSCLDEIQKYSNKVLILGYKEFRKGKTFHSEEVERKKYQWYIRLPLYFDKMILSFDNLSINQLNLKRWFTDKSWDEFFMGEDGTHSMYIDAVSDSFRVSSTGNKHYPIENRNIKEIFSFVQKARIS